MDHFTLTTRMHAYARTVTLGAVAVGGFLVHHISPDDQHPVIKHFHWHAFLICLGLEVLFTLVTIAAHLSPRMLERARGMSAPVLVANTYMMTSVDCALVASAGGVRGPFWIMVLPVVICGGLNQTRKVALSIGVVTVVALVLATMVAEKLHPTPSTWAHLLVICPLIALTGYTSGLICELVMSGTAEMEHERDVVTRHMSGITSALDQAARGDLAASVPHPANAAEQPALETLSASMDHMLGDLRTLVAHVRGGGEQVGASAAELLATAEQHAASANQQSTAVTETTTTIEELAATAAQIAETAEAVARYAAETLAYAAQGGEAVKASVDAMDTIGGSVDAMARRALTLGERTHEIGRIVEVIDDLADQTNLLALNAAIEAARAGDHGRGFAVVATEIRKLAERAQSSTSQIRSIVGEVQAETHATIVASEEGAKEARVGAELARGVAHALDRIGGMVDETTTAAKEISIATQQQRSASEQVVAAMTQVSDVARQYAVGSQQTAASAAELHGLSAGLRDAISRFTVDSPRTSVPVPYPRTGPEPAPVH